MDYLQKLWKTGQDFLGVKYPIMAGAMTWISHHRFVSSVCNEGAFGCLAAGNMPPEMFKEEIDKTFAATDKPFATNLITISPGYQDHLKIALDKGVPYIIFAGSIPKASEIKMAKQSRAKVISFASNDTLAKRMMDAGVDALMLEGSEAGGHIGHVSLIILLQQVLFHIKDIPIFVAGGIATGRMMAHLLLMGASGIQMGTRFILSEECEVNPKFKDAFVKARSRDAIATPAVGSELNVVAVRALRNRGMDEFADLQMELIQKNRRKEITKKDAQFEVEKFWMGALRRAVQEGDIDYGSLMAGQSVGLVKRTQTLKEILTEMIDEANQSLAELSHLLCD